MLFSPLKLQDTDVSFPPTDVAFSPTLPIRKMNSKKLNDLPMVSKLVNGSTQNQILGCLSPELELGNTVLYLPF